MGGSWLWEGVGYGRVLAMGECWLWEGVGYAGQIKYTVLYITHLNIDH